ncbi:MAG: abortive infection family protein [Chloroflexota bacterium]
MNSESNYDMGELISPMFQMKLIKSINQAILKEFKNSADVFYYIKKWYKNNGSTINDYCENFTLKYDNYNFFNLNATLQTMSCSDLLRIAIDLGIETPGFIPSIPIFKNEIKSDYRTAYNAFSKAYKMIYEDPSSAVGFANSALESIIKEILQDKRISEKTTGSETLTKLTSIIIKEYGLKNEEHPKEIKTIASSLIAINQAIESLRSDMTHFHGKTKEDYLINDPIYTSFIINTVATVGLYLISYYKTKYPPQNINIESEEVPF